MIEFNKVSKRYGSTLALSNIDMLIEESKIYCLLGENGAGKTTFLNLIAGLLNATSGNVFVDGKKINMLSMPQVVCFTQERENYANVRIKKLIKIAADFQDGFDSEFALDMMNKFYLDGSKKFKQLSFGMKTMFNTIIGLASHNKVVLFDEPVLGFDPIMRKKFYSLLLESLSRTPKIIITSTHLVDEIADVAQEIMIIHKGQMLLREDITSLQERCYSVTGLKTDVEKATIGKNVINAEDIGKFKTSHIFDDRITGNEKVEVKNLNLQDFFINLIGGNKNE